MNIDNNQRHMPIRRISISNIMPGMIAAEDVYTFTDQLIIQKGTPLTERIITRLKFYSVSEMRIYDESGEAEETEDLLIDEAQTYHGRVKATLEYQRFKDTFTDSTEEFKGMLNDIASGGAIQKEVLLQQVTDIMSQTRNKANLFDILHCMRDSEDTTYTHSLNVALIANAIGQWVGISKEDLPQLTLAGLLHDVGKLMIPQDILNKPGSLTAAEYAMVQTHAVHGYDILKKQGVDERIARVALMHHERCDGSGYPTGVSGNQIDEFSKIVAIADVYDAMSSKRAYRNQICPFEIVQMFEDDGFQKFDPRFVLTFLQNIVDTYVHNTVLLTDGSEGEIVMINRNALSRPMVKSGEEYIDLSRRRDLAIHAIL